MYTQRKLIAHAIMHIQQVAQVLHRANRNEPKLAERVRAVQQRCFRTSVRKFRNRRNHNAPRSSLLKESSGRAGRIAFDTTAFDRCGNLQYIERGAIHDARVSIHPPRNRGAMSCFAEPMHIRRSAFPVRFIPRVCDEPFALRKCCVTGADALLEFLARTTCGQIEFTHRTTAKREMQVRVDESRNQDTAAEIDHFAMRRNLCSGWIECDHDAIANEDARCPRTRGNSSPNSTVAKDARRMDDYSHARARIVLPMLQAIRLTTATAMLATIFACSDSAPAPKLPSPPVAPPRAPSLSTPAPAGAVGAAVEASWSNDNNSTATSDAAVLSVAGLTGPKPVAWNWVKPSMQFRTLQYTVAGGADSTSAADLIVSVFKEGDGGPIDANIERWRGQFRNGEEIATAKSSKGEVQGMTLTHVEIEGDYMSMGAPAPKSGYMQLAAIVEAPGRNVFFRLTGPKSTVEANRALFDALIAGLREGK